MATYLITVEEESEEYCESDPAHWVVRETHRCPDTMRLHWLLDWLVEEVAGYEGSWQITITKEAT